MLKRLLIFGSLLMSTNLCSAGIISFSGYTLNEETRIVSNGELEWLQWSFTRNQGIDEALATTAKTYLGGGWSLANNEQVAGLLNAFNFRTILDTDSRTTQSFQNNDDPAAIIPIENINTDSEKQLVSLFGKTWEPAIYTNDVLDPLEYTSALFSEPNDTKANRVTIFDDYQSQIQPGRTLSGEVILLGNISDRLAEPTAGVALVRAAGTVFTTEKVNSPSGFAYLAIVLGYFGFKRRQ